MTTASAYRRRFFAGVVAALLLDASLAMPVFATPTTPEIATRQSEADAARAELERMSAALEIQVEDYNALAEAVDATAQQILQAEDDVRSAQRDLASAQEALGSRATSMYKSGGTGALEVLFGVRDFQDLIVRLDLMRRIGASDAQVITRVKEAKSRVEARAAALEQRQAEQITLERQAEARATEIRAEVDRQERFVADLEAEVRELIAEEEARLKEQETERARQAAAAAAARRAAGSVSATGRDAADPDALARSDASVVDIALGYLGVPYVWGGSSPEGFDCSGFTQYVYRQVGVSLPRTSRSQYTVGQHIAPDRLDLLQPGDLVFFGTDGDPGRIHHVGMYVGDGNYVHAPYTGTVVRVDSLTSRIAGSGDYVGASRI